MRKLLFVSLLVSLFCFYMPLKIHGQNQQNFEISKSLDIYANVLRELNLNYVNEISAGELNQRAIEAMLESLDPYTVYVPEAQVEDFQLMTTGEYGGIGSLIQQVGNHVYISEPYEGFPAQKAGLRAGDRIMEINGLDATGKSSAEISELLKGLPGTTLHLQIDREDESDPLDIELVRERIRIDNIPYHTVYDNGIGYIRLSGFTQKAGDEVREVFLGMKENHELNGLIIDLRGNGGGLLNEAVEITNLFIERGQLVVTTKGKAASRTSVHRTRKPVTDPDIPVVVMINEGSASASEIVAGALQDYDRAVIIGQRSFGKGLVQNVIPLSYNSQLKITVAHYYIPSGRGIQSVDYRQLDLNDGKAPDSLISAFRTRNNRIVHDRGGIEPDIETRPRSFSQVSSHLFGKNMIFGFANEFARMHDSIANPAEFSINDQDYEAFLQFVNKQDFRYETDSDQAIELLRETAKEEAYLEAIAPYVDALEEKLLAYKAHDFEKHRAEIEELLRVEIAARYYYQKGKIIASLQNDQELLKAFEILTDPELYASILSGEMN